MLAAVQSAAYNPSRWQIWLHAFSSTGRMSFTSIPLSFRTHMQACAADVHDTPITSAPKDPEVFEERSPDYAIVARASVPPPPSILSIVENTLPKSLRQPTPGDAIFEDASFDSDYIASAPISFAHNPSSLAQNLLNLVKCAKYDEASDVLKEIQASGLPIPFSHIYERPAQALLANSNLAPTACASHVVSWLSLLPLAHETVRKRKFLRTRDLIFRSGSANPHVAAAAAVTFASKGYASLIAIEAVPFIMRYASPSFSLQFVSAFEEANAEYCSKYRPHLLHGATHEIVAKVRSMAIESLVHAGHSTYAVELLPDKAKTRFRLTGRACEILQNALDRTPNAINPNYINLLDIARCHAIQSHNETSNEKSYRRQMRHFTPETDLNSSEYVGEEMALRLSKITKSLQDKSDLPAITSIVALLQECLDKERPRLVAKLRRLALNSHPSCASHFLLCEMVYYNSQDLHHLLLKLFVHHFFLSGVPRNEILSVQHANFNFVDSDHPASRIQPAYDEQVQAMFHSKWLVKRYQYRVQYYARVRKGKSNDQYRQKLWPTHAHRNLVWNSLLKLSPSDQAVERLYGHLLKFMSRRETEHDPVTNRPLCYLQTPASQTRVVDTEAFTPFLSRLLSESNPLRGVQILKDMTRVGIIPSIHHLTQVASFYARTGDSKNAFLVLNMLEKQHLLEEGEREEGRSAKFVRNPEDPLPRPDLPFYTSLLRGFLMTGNVVDALTVEARLKQRFAYNYGQHPPLDSALTQLNQLGHQVEAPADLA